MPGNVRPFWGAWAVAVLGFSSSFLGSWHPILWADEVATVYAARRSLGDLFVMLQSVDAVHGLYYVLMHFWCEVFGFSAVSLRFPSAVAVGAACFGTVIVGQKLESNSLGLVAGSFLAVLPRMVWAGSEARQYAITALVLVVVVILVESAWRTALRRYWIAYSAVAVVGIHLFVFFALAIVGVLLASVLANRRIRPTIVSSTSALVISAPFIALTASQKTQVSWIPERSPLEYISAIVIRQFYQINSEDRPGAGYDQPIVIAITVAIACILATTFALVGAVSVLQNPRARPLHTLVLSLLVVPIASLVVISISLQPIYVMRYLTYTAPAVVLVSSLGIMTLRTERVRFSLLLPATIIFIFLPSQFVVKTLNEDGELGIAEKLSTSIRPNDRIAYASSWARIVHPQANDAVVDLSLEESPEESGTLWGTTKRFDDIQFSGAGRVWVLSGPEAFDSAGMLADGCRELSRLSSDGLVLHEYVCS